MKTIFLDFNGVLDTYNKLDIIDEENLKILREVVEETKANVVITSSIKNLYFYTGKHNKIMRYLLETLKENNIRVTGITKKRNKREEEIIEYLDNHPEINHYCIIDDEYDFKSMKDHMIKLKEQQYGGNGLKEINKKEIIKTLNKPRTKISYKEIKKEDEEER